MPISQSMFLEEGNADSLLFECLLRETSDVTAKPVTINICISDCELN